MNALGALVVLLASVTAISWISPAHAHPHSWIDVKIEVSFDAEGRATGLNETWVFDEFYTAFALQGFDRDGDGEVDSDMLAELLGVNMTALADYDYFTRVEAGGKAVRLTTATNAASRMEDNRLVMSFRAPFAAPVSVQDAPLRYAVFDPTYYIEILHAEADDSIQLIAAPNSCFHDLEPPNPNPETVALAYALDQTQSAGDGLGQHFAEWVTIQCD
jgi:ABC-type uncharacterized transport system substrate-binding protein